MTTLRERVEALRALPKGEHEVHRWELINLAMQALEAHERLDGWSVPPSVNSIQLRIEHLRARQQHELARALQEVLDATRLSEGQPEGWAILANMVARMISTCGADSVEASRRTRAQPQRVNQVFVESAGETRSFGLWHGDVTNTGDADLIVASAVLLSESRFDGQVVRQLRRHCGVELRHAPMLLLEHGASTTYIPATKEGEQPAIVVLSAPREVEDWAQSRWESCYEPWVRGCFATLAALETLGRRHRIVALPVLFGNRRPPSVETMRLMIHESAAWLRCSRFTDEIRLAVFLEDEVEEWSQAMDTVLGRVVLHAPEHQEIARLRAQIRNWREKATAEEGALIRDLFDAIANPDALKPGSICSAARTAGEALALEWVRRLGREQPQKWALQRMIEALHSGGAPPLVIAHLQVLRALGNAFSHYDERDPTADEEGADSIVEVLRSVWKLLQMRRFLAP